MELISKADRDNLEINSWERAIVWSALTLRASNVRYNQENPDNNYPHTNAIRITLTRAINDGALTAILRIDATLPYDSPSAMTSGGDFILWLKEFFSGDPDDFDNELCSVLSAQGRKTTNAGDGLPTEPDYVDNLEKYFLWASWQSELSLLSPLPGQLLPITVDFFEESNPDATIRVVANIPIDYEAYRDSSNLLCSVLPLSSQISPAGLRSFSWEEISNKPNFSDVATTGDYDDLTNAPNIPSSLDELSRFDELIRTINGNAPDPTTGNIDITLNVGTVSWINITDRPNFADVSVTGDYNDLINTPNIPVLEWGNISGKPNFSAVAFSGDYNDLTNAPTSTPTNWTDITNKPTFSTVAFSGSYNDLTDKPTNSGGNGGTAQALLGTRTVAGNAGVNLPYNFDGDYAGIINWLGTNAGSQAYSNIITSGIVNLSGVTNSSSQFPKFLDQDISIYLSDNFSANPTLFFTTHEVRLSKVSFYGFLNSGSVQASYDVEASTNGTDWVNLGSFTIIGSNGQWYSVDITNQTYFTYIRLKFVSSTGGTAFVRFAELELYGDIASTNVSDGSLFYNLESSDLYHLIIPQLSVGEIKLLPLATTGLEIGDNFLLYNPHNFNLTITPNGSDQLISGNSLSPLAQGKVASIMKISNTEWLAF